MFRRMITFSLLATIPFIAMSCASYKITKNPDDCNTGLRYYRPKPYLSVVPGAAASTVQISIEYLPDYEEEYAIEIKPGLGINETTIALEKGWNLTSFAGKTDQQYAAILSSLSSMVSAAGGLAKPMAPGVTATQDAATPIDVPFGYYESVFWRDTCGKKHLYGWRYVGLILSGCPVQACPTMHDSNCDDPNELWALIPGGSGGLQFARIADLKSGKLVRPGIQQAPASGTTTPPPPAPTSLRDEVDGDEVSRSLPTRISREKSPLRPASVRGLGQEIGRR